MKKRILILTFCAGVLLSQALAYVQLSQFNVHLHALELLFDERGEAVSELHKMNIDLMRAISTLKMDGNSNE